MTKYRAASVGLCLLVALGSTSGCADGTLRQGTSEPKAISAPSGKDFRALAKHVAKDNGEQAPKDIEWVHTTADAALEIMAGVTEDEAGSAPVYLVQASGKFKLNKSGPNGQPIGGNNTTMLLMVMDAPGEEVAAANYSTYRRDLSDLGTVERLD